MENFLFRFPGATIPKFHHAFHIPENMMRVGKLLSCFVTERKHRISKSAACNVFRHIEHTVLADCINRMCDLITGDETIFLPQHMPKAKRLQIDDQILLHSIEAVLLCGPVKCGDIVWLRI